MDEESIRQDRELARAAIKGLTSYAEQIAHQGKDEEIGQARQKRSTPRQCSGITRIKAVTGLCRYAEEMAEAQGMEEIERIQELPDVIRRMGEALEMCQGDIENACRKIENIAETLKASPQAMGMQL